MKHKFVTTRNKLYPWTAQLCEPENNSLDKGEAWKEHCAKSWSEVTCPKCKALRDTAETRRVFDLMNKKFYDDHVDW